MNRGAWSEDQVSGWLTSLGVAPQHVSVMKKEEMDGEALDVAGVDDLCALGLPRGQALKVLKNWKALGLSAMGPGGHMAGAAVQYDQQQAGVQRYGHPGLPHYDRQGPHQQGAFQQDGQGGAHDDRQYDRQCDRQYDHQYERQYDRQYDRHYERQHDRQHDPQHDRQYDRQYGSHNDRQYDHQYDQQYQGYDIRPQEPVQSAWPSQHYGAASRHFAGNSSGAFMPNSYATQQYSSPAASSQEERRPMAMQAPSSQAPVQHAAAPQAATMQAGMSLGAGMSHGTAMSHGAGSPHGAGMPHAAAVPKGCPQAGVLRALLSQHSTVSAPSSASSFAVKGAKEQKGQKGKGAGKNLGKNADKVGEAALPTQTQGAQKADTDIVTFNAGLGSNPKAAAPTTGGSNRADGHLETNAAAAPSPSGMMSSEGVFQAGSAKEESSAMVTLGSGLGRRESRPRAAAAAGLGGDATDSSAFVTFAAAGLPKMGGSPAGASPSAESSLQTAGAKEESTELVTFPAGREVKAPSESRLEQNESPLVLSASPGSAKEEGSALVTFAARVGLPPSESKPKPGLLGLRQKLAQSEQQTGVEAGVLARGRSSELGGAFDRGSASRSSSVASVSERTGGVMPMSIQTSMTGDLTPLALVSGSEDENFIYMAPADTDASADKATSKYPLLLPGGLRKKDTWETASEAGSELSVMNHSVVSTGGAGGGGTPSVTTASSLSRCASQVSVGSDEGMKPATVVVGTSALPEAISLAAVTSVPKDENGNYLSIGSHAHFTGNCVPCKWTRSARGCRDGTLCMLCHGDHDNLTRHGMRNMVRRHGLQKRQMFGDGDPNQGGAQENSVKNTFIHVQDTDGVTDVNEPKKIARSASQGSPFTRADYEQA